VFTKLYAWSLLAADDLSRSLEWKFIWHSVTNDLQNSGWRRSCGSGSSSNRLLYRTEGCCRGWLLHVLLSCVFQMILNLSSTREIVMTTTRFNSSKLGRSLVSRCLFAELHWSGLSLRNHRGTVDQEMFWFSDYVCRPLLGCRGTKFNTISVSRTASGME